MSPRGARFGQSWGHTRFSHEIISFYWRHRSARDQPHLYSDCHFFKKGARVAAELNVSSGDVTTRYCKPPASAIALGSNAVPLVVCDRNWSMATIGVSARLLSATPASSCFSIRSRLDGVVK